jgi:hypothetical protein
VLDLYLYSSHEIAVWAPLLAPLRSSGVDVRFVLEPPGRNVARGSAPDPARGWVDEKGRHLVHLLDSNTEATILAELATIQEEPLTRRRPSAAAVTTAGSRWLNPYAGARIRSMYGVGFVRDAWGHGDVNAGFDLVLAHGSFSVSEIRKRVPDANVEVVGFPKWAAFRRGELSRDAARGRLGLDERPAVAWLPTWAQNSSIGDSEALAALGTDVQVVMKPHHNNVRFERERLAGVAPGITVLPSTTSLVDLLVAAELVISDVRSGGFTEALLADRPVVGLIPPGSSRDSVHEGAWEAADICADLAELPRLVARSLADDPHADGRRKWVPELFGDTKGDDDDLAASAIADGVERYGGTLRRHVSAAAWRVAYRLARGVGR